MSRLLSFGPLAGAPYNTRPMSRSALPLRPTRLLALAYIIAALLVMQALRVHGHADQDHHHSDASSNHVHPVQVHLTYLDGTAADVAPAVDLTSEGIVDDAQLPPLVLALLTALLTWPGRRPSSTWALHSPPALRHPLTLSPPVRAPPRVLRQHLCLKP